MWRIGSKIGINARNRIKGRIHSKSWVKKVGIDGGWRRGSIVDAIHSVTVCIYSVVSARRVETVGSIGSVERWIGGVVAWCLGSLQRLPISISVWLAICTRGFCMGVWGSVLGCVVRLLAGT